MINLKFHQTCLEIYKKLFPQFYEIIDQDIPGFPSVDVLLFLLHPQLERLKGPVLDCLNDVHSYLDQLSHKIVERVFYRFPSMSGEISDLSSHVLAKERENCRQIVENLIDAEEGYIFTNDVEYLTKRTDIIPKSEKKRNKKSRKCVCR